LSPSKADYKELIEEMELAAKDLDSIGMTYRKNPDLRYKAAEYYAAAEALRDAAHKVAFALA
jgi:hypothetical protein